MFGCRSIGLCADLFQKCLVVDLLVCVLISSRSVWMLFQWSAWWPYPCVRLLFYWSVCLSHPDVFGRCSIGLCGGVTQDCFLPVYFFQCLYIFV